MAPPRRAIPADVAAVVSVYQELGDAARRGLFLAERVTEHQVRQAALYAAILRGRLKPRTPA